MTNSGGSRRLVGIRIISFFSLSYLFHVHVEAIVREQFANVSDCGDDKDCSAAQQSRSTEHRPAFCATGGVSRPEGILSNSLRMMLT